MSYIGAKPAEQILSSADIQDGAISTVDLADNSITRAKLDSNLQAGFQGRNKIINGHMVVDQRNAGASVTNSASTQPYCLDRWWAYGSQSSKYTVQQNAGSVTPPVGFSNYLGVTSLSSYTVGSSEQFRIAQAIEGYNSADLNFGSANAKTVTLSFWVRSSLTGSFGGSLNNGDYSRSYPFLFTIASANTWEQKTITVAGDTTGTWNTTTSAGLWVLFSLGVGSALTNTAGTWATGAYINATGATSVVGTSGATFYITGVQLEEGTTATSFERESYSVTLQKCQRYFEKSYAIDTAVGTATTTNQLDAWTYSTASYFNCFVSFKVTKRVAPTTTVYNPVTGSSGSCRIYPSTNGTGGAAQPSVSGFLFYTPDSVTATYNIDWHYSASAEL